MLLSRRPRPETLQRFLDRQAGLPLSYQAVGATGGRPPDGYVVDHTRVRLGSGEETFLKARAAIERWDQFRLGWLDVWPPSAPIVAGTVIAILARWMGLWWLNACRIIQVIDESEPIARFGFAYGTLPGHAGTGEERFLVEWDPADGQVFYDILAFSRPQRTTARLGYPLMRRLQKRFGRESAAAMQRAVRRQT